MLANPLPRLMPIEHICAYCAHYTFRDGNPDGLGTAYCRHYDQYFPDQLNPERTPAGMRGGKCKHWKHMGERDEAE